MINLKDIENIPEEYKKAVSFWEAFCVESGYPKNAFGIKKKGFSKYDFTVGPISEEAKRTIVKSIDIKSILSYHKQLDEYLNTSAGQLKYEMFSEEDAKLLYAFHIMSELILLCD